jgi:hypothetical protein
MNSRVSLNPNMMHCDPPTERVLHFDWRSFMLILLVWRNSWTVGKRSEGRGIFPDRWGHQSLGVAFVDIGSPDFEGLYIIDKPSYLIQSGSPKMNNS